VIHQSVVPVPPLPWVATFQNSNADWKLRSVCIV